MNDKARETMASWHMLQQGDEVLVGVSGGADSVALLHFLGAISQDWGISLRAAHVNHNLRGSESQRDEDFVRNLCCQGQVELVVCSLPPQSADDGQSVEEWARTERYRFFEEAAKPTEKIATAHTLNDSAETQLLNLMRGTGLRGLGGIPPVRGRIIRPLIACTRADIEAYCRQNSLDFITDSTNLTNDYTRNRLRHQVLPVLEDMNPAYLANASRSMGILRQEEDYLESQAQKALIEMTEQENRYNRGAFLQLPEVLAMRLLRLICRQRGLPWDTGRLQLLYAQIRAGAGAVQLNPRCRLVSRPDVFFVEEQRPCERGEDKSPEFIVDFEGKQEWLLPFYGKYIHLFLLKRQDFDTIYKTAPKLLKNALDYDRIVALVALRGRQPGDTFAPQGRSWTKKLKKLLNEEGIPPEQRDKISLLARATEAGGEVLWLAGYGVAEGYGVTDQTSRVLVVTIKDENEKEKWGDLCCERM